MSNKQAANLSSGLVDDFTACRAKMAGFSDLVACLTERFACPYLVYFGKERYCSHPKNVQIAGNTESE